MNEPDSQRAAYRAIIDDLVTECLSGQGQVVRHHVQFPPHPDPAGDALADLDDSTRAAVVKAVADAFVAGVHTALVALDARQVSPFDQAYEGTAFHDFMGRLDGWDWPER